MKTNYGKIWVLTMTILITLSALPCLAVEKKGADIWAQDRPRHKHRQPGGGQGKMRKMLEKHTEYLEWLEKNYPDKAKELAKLKDANPQLYKRVVYLGLKKYGQIAKVEKENPELAKVLTEDMELKMERNELLRKIRSAADDDKKKELIGDLEKVISDRFDLIVKRKQMEYERLRKELKKLEKEVRKNEDEVEKWKDSEFKDENIKARLEELVSQTDKFRWE